MCKKPVFLRFLHSLHVLCFACLCVVFSFSDAFADVPVFPWTANVDGGTVSGVARCGPKSGSTSTALKSWVASNYSLQAGGCFCRVKDIDSVTDWNTLNDASKAYWYGSGTNFSGGINQCSSECAAKCVEVFESNTSYQQSLCGGDCPLDSGTTTEYTITYDNNGGSGCEDETYTTTSDPLCEPTRDGYTFDVWMDVDTLEEYAAGTQVSGTNLNLEAQWIQNATYSIIYYNELPDGATNCTTCSNVNNYTGQQTLCTPSCAGYVFGGWMDDDTGDTFNENGAVNSVTNRNLVLYGVWTEIVQYTITYNLEGGYGCPSSITYIGSQPLCTPYLAHYTFDGWIDDDDNIYNLDGTTDTISGKDIVLTASWTLSSCDDGYYLENSACKSCSTQTGGEFPFSDGNTAKSINDCYKQWSCPVSPSCPEYSTNCQYIGATSGFDYFGNETTHCSVSYDCTTGYSQQSLNSSEICALDNYTISLNTNDGYFPIGTVVPNSYTYESAQINLPNPSRNGYTFAGWCDNETLTQNCSDNKYIPTQSTGNKTFYASWVPVTYNITYNLNGASYDLNYHNATTYQTDSLYDFQISAPNERNGYEFNGWCDDADLEINCSVNKTIAAGDYGDKEFYASWTPITYTITYVSNGGTVYPNAYYTIESPQIILPQNPARTNFDFMGWWDNKYFNGESVDTLGPNAYGNKTFYAKWFADYDCSQDTNVYSPRTSLETVQEISNNTQYEYNGDWYYLLKGSSNSWNLLSASSANSSPEKYAQYEAELDYYTSDQGWSVTFDDATVSGYAVCAARGWGTIGAENNGVLTGTFVGCACSLDKQRWIGAGQLSTTTNNWGVNNENCRKNCPATCAEAIAKNTSNIRDLLFNGTCPVPSNIIRCDQGQFIYDDTCVYSCNDRLEFHGTCVTSCPDLTYEYNGTCVDSCPNGTYKDNGVCVNSCGNKLIYDDMCVDSCNDRFEYNGNCIISCPDNTVRYNQTCLDQCPNGTYIYNSVCMESCPEDTYSLGTNCVDSCGDKLIYGSMCVDDCDDRIEYEGMCYEQCPYGTYAKDGTCVSDCGKGMMGAESECIPSKFELETIVNPGTFKFSISAKGTYYIDWGDGKAETQTIYSPAMTTITHDYPSGTNRSYRIKISGEAQEYSTGATDAAIRFGNLDNQSINSGDKITKIYGSLSDVFPTIGSGDTLSTQPRFYKTFMNCTNLFGEIPENLFASLTGEPVSYMFFGTFMGCGKLGSEYNSSLDEYIPTYSIPEYLFGDVSGKPGTHVFNGTFSQCAGLTGNIPSTLFENINGDLDSSEEAVFAGTFYMCSGLTGSIPEYLFSGVHSAPKKKMFNSTFYGCTNLSGELPQHLFDSISGDIVQDSFNKTFYNTPNLSGFVPVDFFKNITNSNNISDGMPEIFEGSGIDTLCPAGYQQHETIFDEYWSGHVSCEPCPAGQTSEAGGTCYIAEKTCYSGTYFNIELTPPDCDTCPENHYCPNGTWTIATADQSLNQCPQTYKHSPSGSYDEYACYATVTYVSNDGEEGIINHQKYSDSSPNSFSVDLPNLTRDGYTFVGWYDNEQLNGDALPSGTNTFYGDKTLYAKWGCPDGYTSTTNGQITDSGTQCYTDCPVSTGYQITSGHKYLNGDITSCVITPITYTIIYNLDGGTNNPNNPVGYTIETATIVLQDPSKTGYNFVRWVDNSGNPVTQIAHGSTGDVTINAQWTKSDYTITYNLNGGTNNPNNPSGYSVESETIILQDPNKNGYSFGGWLDENDEPITQIEQDSTGNISLTAQWTPIEYTISIDFDGGDWPSTLNPESIPPHTYNIENNTIVIPEPVRMDYRFDGWFDTNNSKVTQIEQGSTGDISLTARWLPVEYSITYMDGTEEINGLNPGEYSKTDETFNLPTPNKNGYTFINWFDNPELDGEPVTQITKGSNEDKVFYAKWVMDYYTITFMDGDKVLSNPVPITYNAKTPTFYLTDASKEDYNFVKWVDADGNMVNKIPRGSYGDKVLYAQWTPKSFTIEYVLNGGKMHENTPTTYRYGIGATINVIPEKYSFEFVGWCSDEQLQHCAKPYIIPTNATTKQTLYAKWKYVCESGKWLRLGVNENDRICLYDKPLSHPSMAISVENTPYYITLSSDTDKTINTESAYKMHVEYLGTPYNAYDPLME